MSKRPTRCLICEARLSNPVCQLPADALNQFAELSITSTFRAGEILFAQGDTCVDVFIVRSGLIRLTYFHPDGAEQVLRIAGPGEIIGAGVSGDRTVAMTATTRTPTTVCRTKFRDVEHLVGRDPRFALAWGHLLMDEIRRAREAVFHLGPHPAGVRLARLLLELARKRTAAAATPPLARVTHADLASSLSIAQETATRLLAELQEQNVVKLARGHIEILDMDRLTALAGFPGSDVDVERLA